MNKSLNIANREAAVYRQPAAQNTDGHIAHIADEIHHRHHQAGKELRLPCRIIKLVVVGIELLHTALFPVESLHYHMAAVHFFNMAVDMAQILLLCPKIFLGMLDNDGDKHH